MNEQSCVIKTEDYQGDKAAIEVLWEGILSVPVAGLNKNFGVKSKDDLTPILPLKQEEISWDLSVIGLVGFAIVFLAITLFSENKEMGAYVIDYPNQ